MKTRPRKKKSVSQRKKPQKKIIKKVVKKTPAKGKLKLKATDGMNDFQQCVVLAALINHKRNTDSKFLFIPLPDINSPALAPVRELIGNYKFTPADIMSAIKKVLTSKEFKACFPTENGTKNELFNLSKSHSKEIMAELLELAGPEAKKVIYIKEKEGHEIHKTTLEKYALKLGLIDPLILFGTQFPKQDSHLAHKQILIKLSLNKLDKSHGGSFSRYSMKQRRGRG